MVKPNYTIGTVFEDGGLYYEVQAVLPSGDYISKRVDKVPEPEKEITVPIPEHEQEIHIPEKTEDKPVKKTRTTTRTRNTGGRKKQ